MRIMKSRATEINRCEFCNLNLNAGQQIIMENESCYFLQLDELQKVKVHIDNSHKPDGYNIGWNVYETGGQHINHAHMHVMPRYHDEKLAYKGIRSHLKDKSNRRSQNDPIG